MDDDVVLTLWYILLQDNVHVHFVMIHPYDTYTHDMEQTKPQKIKHVQTHNREHKQEQMNQIHIAWNAYQQHKQTNKQQQYTYHFTGYSNVLPLASRICIHVTRWYGTCMDQIG